MKASILSIALISTITGSSTASPVNATALSSPSPLPSSSLPAQPSPSGPPGFELADIVVTCLPFWQTLKYETCMYEKALPQCGAMGTAEQKACFNLWKVTCARQAGCVIAQQ
ncbi:uncharacterized protein F4807DRAFT_470639 [Annulohypoxylon truncatum]|uniref:uncharacterized protein n=1 Tax=Annulohypoxylon truncatum TaxID=327061 RepID=UPI002007FA5E|nr:uncharacterized protein F4807DRAFT_470639 [Annulohypoxylon truncatum]KAI1205881.1 hypothetical protein F4807DRAFT_470639 [Annulohypoxylon truncatum]